MGIGEFSARHRLLAGAVVALLTAAAGAGSAAAVPRAPVPQYVALGDSYSSLPATATGGPTQEERSCGRSVRNYPKLLAATLGLAGDQFRDNTCGGAKTRDAFSSQHAGDEDLGYFDAPPQLSGIGAATTLVTVSLGGNDDDLYSSIVAHCVRTKRAPIPCTSNESSRPASLSDAAINTTLHRITASDSRIVRAVRDRAPHARILLIGYPRVFERDRTCGQIAAYDAGSLPWISSILTRRLNEAVRQAARNEHAEFVDMEPATRGHELCSASPWINGTEATPRAIALHPFPEEGEAVAGVVGSILRGTPTR